MNIIDTIPLLTPARKSLLERCASAPFMLGGFLSLDDIVTKLKVEVIIESGTPSRSIDDYYDRAAEYWQKMYEKFYKMSRENRSFWSECQKAEKKWGRVNVEREAHSSMSLLGLYDRQQNIIKLFPEAMAKEDASRMDEYLVSTLAHEIMHAYFNRPEHDYYPYAMFVEEPLAEFGMLMFLHETNSTYYDWAHNNVRGKKSCYGYGADIMDQYLDGDKSLRKYLEEYKIPIGEYERPDIANGHVSMPKEGDVVNVAGQHFVAEWTPLYSVPPTYFWDDTTKILGLNGDWRGERIGLLDNIYTLLYLQKNCRHVDIQYLYLGKDFFRGHRSCRLDILFSAIPVMVSPQHKDLTSINGILVYKSNHSPVLHYCGDGYYELKRNGKYAIIDSNLMNITPFKYNCIWRFDENGLCKVRIGDRYGLVNKQGVEQVPAIYVRVTKKGYHYMVEQNGEVFIIDEFGNKQPKKGK